MEKTSISTPTSSSARMSRSKNVATRAGYLLVKTASLTRSPREPVLAQPQLERENFKDPLVQPSATDGTATGPGARVAELAQPARHEAGGQDRPRAGSGPEQQVFEHRVKAGGEHHVERDREAVLGMGGHGLRQPAGGELAQHDLTPAAVRLGAGPEGGAPPPQPSLRHGPPHRAARPHAY